MKTWERVLKDPSSVERCLQGCLGWWCMFLPVDKAISQNGTSSAAWGEVTIAAKMITKTAFQKGNVLGELISYFQS